MEKMLNCCTLTSLVALVVLVLCPARSWCKEDAYKPLTEAKPACCVNEDAVLKRFDDIDDDSFVSLMGRRSAAQPSGHRDAPVSRKRNRDHVLADLLGRRTSTNAFCKRKVTPPPITTPETPPSYRTIRGHLLKSFNHREVENEHINHA